MSAEVKIIHEGWINEDCVKVGKEPTTSATITLIKDGDIIAVVDPGELPSQQVLIDALKDEGLEIEDITHVFVTHSHIDHYRNVGIFPETATVVEYFGQWQEGRDSEATDLKLGKFSENIEIVSTPGHNYDGLTFLVDTKGGTVAVVGDVWWKENYPKKDPYATDLNQLKKNRKKILEIADYIIPGHGKMFKVDK
jgi:glyoxylase-like metal-dependent hydrolase (beta-lactamase superfamily II)